MTATADRMPARVVVARVLSVLVAVAVLVSGARAIRRSATLFPRPARKVYLREFSDQVRHVEAHVPPGAYVLHVSSPPEYWYSRLWQRALYPRNGVIVLQAPLAPERLRELRQKYATRFVLSAGDPPADIGFVTKTDLGPVSNNPGTTWFGELSP